MSAPENDVIAELSCPTCGERDADHLEIHEDDTVRCLACGTTYRIDASPDSADERELN